MLSWQIIGLWLGVGMVVALAYGLTAQFFMWLGRRRIARRRAERRGGFVQVPTGQFTDQDRAFCRDHGVAL